jgi:hypothetical protein
LGFLVLNPRFTYPLGFQQLWRNTFLTGTKTEKDLTSILHKRRQHMYYRVATQGCVAYVAMEINIAEFAEYTAAVVAVLSGSSARSLANLLFLLAGRVERAVRAREPGIEISLGPRNPVSAAEENRSARDGEGNLSKLDQNKSD